MTCINVMEYDLEEVRKEINTPKKGSSYELCEAIIKEIVHMRQHNNLSQNELADMSGARQPMIARIEHGITPQTCAPSSSCLQRSGKPCISEI